MPSIRPFVLLLIGVSASLAQDTAPNEAAPPGALPPGALPPGAIPPTEPASSGGSSDAPRGAAAMRPPNVNPEIPLGENLILEDIIEPKLSGNELASLYRAYTGRRVIVSAAAAQAEFAFVQDASEEDPLTFAQAADLVRKAAAIENFIFVPDGTDPTLDYLTLATGGIRPSGIGIDVFTEGDDLPEGGVVISYIMSFDHIKPENAVNAFQQVVGQFGAFGSIAPIPNTASVVITENTTLIRKLIDLKREIDKPSAQVATRFIRVQYADVTELAATLNELLNSQQDSQTTAGIQRTDAAPVADGAAAAAGAAGAAGQGASQAGETTPVQIIPDPRTSRIFAMGRPVDLLFVEGLIREFDTQTDNRTFLRRKLKFLTVSEFLPIAGDALTRAFSGTGDSGGAATAGGGGRANQTRGQSNRAGGGAASGFDNQGGNFGGQAGRFGGQAGGFGGGGGGMARGNALGNPNISSAPESMLVGRTLLVADNITNSVIVQGPPSGIEIVERLLDQLDVKADQVMISTVFGQLSLNNNVETGLDYIVRGSDVVARGGGGFAPNIPILSNAIAGAATSEAFPGSLSPGAGLKVYGSVGDLSVYLRALESQSDFTVLSRPSIFMANNQLGTISSGRRIAVPTNSNQFAVGGIQTNIEYRDVVLKLEVIPLINDEKTITMQIALVSDDVVGSQTFDNLGTVPIIGTREILTTVTVPNNETVVLGGLITSNDEETVSGVPILSSIPGIGRLFSSNVQTVNREELIIFIQPSIVNDDESLQALQAKMDSRYSVSATSREFSDGNVINDGPAPLIEGSNPAIKPVDADAPTSQQKNTGRKKTRPLFRH